MLPQVCLLSRSTSANFDLDQLAEVELAELELAEVEHPLPQRPRLPHAGVHRSSGRRGSRGGGDVEEGIDEGGVASKNSTSGDPHAVQFIERVKKRVAGTDEKIRKAAKSGASESSISSTSRTAHSRESQDMEAEVIRLRAQVVQLQAQAQNAAVKRRAVGSSQELSTMISAGLDRLTELTGGMEEGTDFGQSILGHRGIFEDVQFYPIEFGPFWGLLIFSMFLHHHEFSPFGPPSPLTFHNVKNHGGGVAEGEPGGIAKNEEQKKTKKTTHRGKPRQTEMKQRKTLGARQTI